MNKMGFGVLVGVPLSCPEYVTLRLEECLRSVLHNMDTFRVVRDVVSYLQAIQENREDYKVSIVNGEGGFSKVQLFGLFLVFICFWI